MVRGKRLSVLGVLAALLALLGAPVHAQHGGPLVITLSTDKQVAVAREPLWLTISITNVSDQPFSAPNIRFWGEDRSAVIHAGMLLPTVINSRGELVGRVIFAGLSSGPTEEQELVMLQPGETISVRTNISTLYGFDEAPGDYAITTPAVFGDHHSLKQLQQFVVSNTCFVRILPRQQALQVSKAGKPSSTLAMRISVGKRSAHSGQSPVQLGKDTYLPTDAAAQLVGAKITNTADRIVLERGGKRLVLAWRENMAVLPSGAKKRGVAVPFAGGKHALVPVTLLHEAFGMSRQVAWRVVSRG